jgi:hypothetical protein
MTQHNSSLPKATFSVYLGSALFFIYIVFSTTIVGFAILIGLLFSFDVRYKIALIFTQTNFVIKKIVIMDTGRRLGIGEFKTDCD